MQSKTITLTAANAGNIDSGRLDQCNSPTEQQSGSSRTSWRWRKMFRVQKQINFLSSNSSFQVAAINGANGEGLNNGVAKGAAGTIATGTGSTIAVDTQQVAGGGNRDRSRGHQAGQRAIGRRTRRKRSELRRRIGAVADLQLLGGRVAHPRC